MDDFFDKIKKKLSVDNILDFMKDGKLKEEIKQTLTAKINLNDRPKQDEARTPLEVPMAFEPKKHVTIENIQHNTAEDQCKLKDKESKEQLGDNSEQKKNVINVLQKPNVQPQTKNNE